MKIAVNARELLKGRMEGIGRYIFETTKRMVLDHPEDQFFFLFDRKYDESFIFADNITPIVVHPQSRHPLLWYIWFEIAIPYILKKHKINVFYSGDTYLSMKTKVPTLLVCHDVAYKHYPNHIKKIHLNYYENNFEKFHKKADHIIAVSEYTRQDIIRLYELDPEKVTVGYNATPAGFIPLDNQTNNQTKANLTAGAPYFIYVGSLHPRKNVVNLIKAFDQFKIKTRAPHKLVLVGRMAWRNEALQAIYQSIVHREQIIFTGHVSNDKLPKYVAAAEALTYVSLFEGFGIPILEAMSAGTPVITSNVSSMPEVSGDAAILVDPHNPASIAIAMEKISNDSSLKEQLIKKGLVRAKQFDWSHTGTHIYNKLAELAEI